MNISKEDIVRVNKGFGGYLRNNASLEFATAMQGNRKVGEYKKLAYLWRALLVDHCFSGGNKRTAMFVAFAFAEGQERAADRELLLHHVQSIASKNIINIRQIETRLKNAIR